MNGFFFANPAGLWSLAAVGMVTALYLFSRRRRSLPVTGLFLWGTPPREGMGGRRLEPPPPSRSLLLDALAAAGFALALAGPALRIGAGPPRIIVLDDAFSMRARESHRQALRLAERLLIEAEEAGVGAAVILAGDRELILTGPGTPVSEALAALSERYLPSSAPSSWRKAVALARNRYGEDLEFDIIGNREISPDAGGDGQLRFHILPGRGGNFAFGRIWRLAGDNPGEETLSLSAINYGNETASAILSLAGSSGGAALREEEVRIASGGSVDRELSISGMATETLCLRLIAPAGQDVIADDSIAWLPSIPDRTISFGLSGLGDEASRYFRLALEATGCRPLAGENGETPVSDLLVAGGPDGKGGSLTVELVPVGNPGTFNPPYVVDSADPLCRDLDLANVPWVIANRVLPAKMERVYAMAGGMPLYWRSAGDRLHLNLYTERCPIVHSPAWPVLIANLAAEAERLLPGLRRSACRPGEILPFRSAGSGETLLFLDDREVARAPAGRELVLPKQAGLYQIRAEQIGAEVSVLPLYGPASDTRGLAPAARLIRSGNPESRGSDGVVDLAWLAFGLGAFCLGTNWRAEERT